MVVEKVRAWELLRDPEYCGNLTTGRLYDLMLRAGYGERAAQDAANERGWARLSANLVM
jgi:hypothetical protein